jgi:ISXO2-like transposase domain
VPLQRRLVKSPRVPRLTSRRSHHVEVRKKSQQTCSVNRTDLFYPLDPLKTQIRETVVRGSHIWTDDNKSYYGFDGYGHTPRVRGKLAAHVIMPWIHRVFSNAKRWGLGVFHGFREKYLGAYLNEFVFRWNRRHSHRSAFDRLLGIGVAIPSATRADIMGTAV